jgi:hypothetical protein
MAQIREVYFGALNASSLPPTLIADMQNAYDLDEQEAAELQTYIVWATSSAKTQEDWSQAIQNALFLFFEQRRRTRTWVIGCSVAAGALGVLMGYFVGKKA